MKKSYINGMSLLQWIYDLRRIEMNWLYLWLSYALGQISALGIIWLGHIMLSENDSNSGKSIFEKKQAD